MTSGFKKTIAEAVENVKEKVKKARGKYFDTYNVLDELRAVGKGKEYVEFLCGYVSDDHPFLIAHKEIGKYLYNNQNQLGIKKVIDQDTNEAVRIYIPENIVYGSDTVQLWRIVK